MSGRFSVTISAFLLACSLLNGRCPSCRTPVSEEPVHDCCNQGSCHRESNGSQDHRTCPYQWLAAVDYAKVEVVAADTATPASQPAQTSSPAPALAGSRVARSERLVAHSPPELYLRNSILLI